jgi:HAMP domain-containing protein
MEEMVRQTDQLINFTREINRRIADSGISGVDGLVALYDQLRSALAKVSPQEIEWAQGEVNRVLDSLRRLSDELQHLAGLKAALETSH